MAKIIDGKNIALTIRLIIKRSVLELGKKDIYPGLATIIVGNNSASRTYIKNKIKASNEVGIKSYHFDLEEKISETNLVELINRLNKDNKVDGILVQLPLPKHLNENNIIDCIKPEKDVDGFNIKNAGKIFLNRNGIAPCTPLGCLLLLRSIKVNLEGKNVVVIGRSNIVGKPIAQLLLNENCTVTIVHSRTKNISNFTKEADILIAAVGKPEIVKKEWLKKGSIVIDVGINRVEKDGEPVLVGDVDFNAASKVASYITPVPGGVGPMTIACLLVNTAKLACLRKNVMLPKILKEIF